MGTLRQAVQDETDRDKNRPKKKREGDRNEPGEREGTGGDGKEVEKGNEHKTETESE